MKTFRISLALVVYAFVGSMITVAQEMPIYEWANSFPRNSGHGVWSDHKSTTDANGNVYISGVMNADFDADPGPGVHMLTEVNSNYDDVYIIKLNSSGIFQWAHKYDRVGAQNGAGAIVVDAAGNVFFASYYQLSYATNDTRINKYDAAGNELWQKIIATRAWGGRTLELDPSGNLLMAGGFAGTVDFDPNAGTQNRTASTSGYDNEMFLLKLTNDGDFMWVKTTSGTGNKIPMALTRDASGNILISGQYAGVSDFDLGPGTVNHTPVGAGDAFVLKLEEDGDLLWSKSMGGTDIDVAHGIATNAAGNIFVTGYFHGSADYDPNAGVVTLSTTSDSDMFLLRLNPDGSFGWASQFGTPGYPDEGRSIAIDAAGNLIVTGTFMGTVDFDPGAGVTNLTSAGTFLRGNTFIMKLTENQTFIWARAFGGSTSGSAMGTSVKIDNSGMITVVGHFIGAFQANFGPCNNNLSSSTMHAFIVKLLVGFEAQPTVTSISPTFGPVGTEVVITGTNFGTDPADLEVRFAPSRQAIISSVTPTTITTNVPTSAVSGPIFVRLKCFTGVFTPTFTVGTPATPTVTGFTPSSGPTGTTVTITGTNFSTTPANNTVRFNGTTAVVTASSTVGITTTVPAGATTGTITVMVGAATATSASAFTVTCGPTPAITSFSPSSGTIGTVVTINGTNFSTTPANNVVHVNGMLATVTSSTVSTIVISVPNGTSGTGPITVTVNGCGPATSSNNFAMLCPNPPTITSFTPTSGVVGSTVTITGTNFTATPADHTVRVNGAVASITASTTTTLTITVPAGAIGMGPVSVTMGGCGVATSAVNFTATCGASCAPEISVAELTTQPGGTIVLDLKPLITTTGTLDVSSITVTGLPPSGATAIIEDGVLTITYSGTSFSGTETISIQACNTNGTCSEQEFTIEVIGDVVVYNAVSPNGDDKNDIFFLHFIDLLPDTKTNQVLIFNRWGDEVFSVRDYDNKTRVFEGVSNGGNKLPSGVYFYKVNLPDQHRTLTGYLELKF